MHRPVVQQTLWEWAHGGVQGERESKQAQPVRGALFMRRIAGDKDEAKHRLTRAQRLHRGLEAYLGLVELTITDNRRRMVTARRHDGGYKVRAHQMFLKADEGEIAWLARFCAGECGAQEHVQRFIHAHRETIQGGRALKEQLHTAGRCHDLEALLASAMELLGWPQLDGVRITWGKHSRGKRSIRLGSYDFGQRLIRIHPALDRAFVPRYFVEFVVYHELLHALCPPDQGKTRRCIHTPAFRARERQYPLYEEALAWESANLKQLLERS